MGKPSKLTLAALATATVTLAASAVTITEDTTVSSGVTYAEHLYVDANLTISAGTLQMGASGNSKKCVWLPYTAGNDATIRLTGGTLSFYWPDPSHKPSHVYIGQNGGTGHIVVDSGTANMNYVAVCPNAVADASGFIDFLTLNGGTAKGVFHVTNTVPARIVFSGGKLMSTASGSNVTRELFNIGPDSRAVLHADGKDMTVDMNQGKYQNKILLATGDGVLETSGVGNLVFVSSGGSDALVHFTADEDHAAWGHDGDTVLNNNANAILDVDQGLPHGANTGVFRFQSADNARPKNLDLNGHASAVNGLVFDAKSLANASNFITNSSTTAEGVLQFGARGEDSTLTASVFGGDCAVEKLGAGTLTITKGVMPKLRVLGGTVRVTGSGVVASDIVVSNATLVIDGVTLSSTRVTCIDGGSVSLANGGSLPAGCEVRRCLRTADYPSKWTRFGVMDYGYEDPFQAGTTVDIVKTGTDTFTYFQAAPTIADVDVREGRLRFGGVADANQYPFWRMTIRKSGGAIQRTVGGVTTNVHVGLGRWWVVTPALDGADSTTGSAGPSLLPWGSNADVGTAPANLTEGQWTTGKAWLAASGEGSFSGGAVWQGPAALGRPFYNNSYQSYYSTVFANATPDPADASTWETVAFRLTSANAAKASGGYLLSKPANADSCTPVSWTVEASADGESWTTMDTRENVDRADISASWWMNGGRLFLFNANAASWIFAPTGMVKVAADATLDLTEIPDANVSFKGLEIDMTAGAGTITHFAPAANGVLELVNADPATVDANGQLSTRVALPLTVTTVGDLSNLATWTVVVDGAVQGGAAIARRADGVFVVSRTNPTVITFK